MNIDRATEFEAALMRRAYESGDKDLSKAVIILVNQAIMLRYQNAQLHLGVNPYTDPAMISLNRIARQTRHIARVLQAVLDLVPEQFSLDGKRMKARNLIKKAEWAFEQMNLPPLMKDKSSDPASEPCGD